MITSPNIHAYIGSFVSQYPYVYGFVYPLTCFDTNATSAGSKIKIPPCIPTECPLLSKGLRGGKSRRLRVESLLRRMLQSARSKSVRTGRLLWAQVQPSAGSAFKYPPYMSLNPYIPEKIVTCGLLNEAVQSSLPSIIFTSVCIASITPVPLIAMVSKYADLGH